ncbi:MAG: AraC family transcriptional regulator [Polyangiales bacterium]
MSIAVVRTLVETVEDCGVSRGAFLRATSFDSEQFADNDARVSGLVVYGMCDTALDLTGDRGLGLQWGAKFVGAALGPLGHLITHAATLREGLNALVHFSRLISDHAPWELIERDNRAVLRCRWLPTKTRMRHFVAEIMTANFFRLLREFDRHVRPVRVSFEYAAPPHRELYTQVFERTEHFDQPYTGIVFDRALLDRPSPNRDEDIHAAISALAERRLLRLTELTPYAVRVRDLLVRGASPHRTDMPTVARSLGMSARSLRRRLSAEGKPYNELVNEALAIMAKQLLRGTRRTIQETAFELGFSDARTFHRAFKRWTGQTPNAYRKGTIAASE